MLEDWGYGGKGQLTQQEAERRLAGWEGKQEV